MRKLFLIVLALCATVAMSSTAFGYSLYIDWQGGTYSISYTLNGNPGSSGIASARGWLENPGNTNHLPDAGGRDLGWVFCVDLKNYADDPDEFLVTRYTQDNDAASQADWRSPLGDDGLRAVGGLNQAAYLANLFGPSATTHAKRVGLNVALWRAAYGASFVYTGGLGNPGAEARDFYDLALQSLGGAATEYEWFDNDDAGNYHQDFLNDVPEPTSLLLLGGVITGAAALAWKRRRNG